MHPPLLTYTGDTGMAFTIINGIPPQQPGRLQVTVCISAPGMPDIYQTLDLYDHKPVHQLGLSMRLKPVYEAYYAGMSALTSLATRYLQAQAAAAATPVPASATGDKDTAVSYLQHDRLMEQTMDDLQATGIEGERENSMILYLAMMSAKCANPVSVILQGESGAGKSYLADKISACMPADAIYECTHSSPAGIFRTGEALDDKVCLVHDMDAAPKAAAMLMELHARGRISRMATIGNKNGAKTIRQSAKGNICFVGCTARTRPPGKYAANALLINLAGSDKQDAQIAARQQKLKAGTAETAKEQQAAQRLQSIQQVLQPVKVINPYAPLITLPPATRSPKRMLPILLSFIEVITWYHQHQRIHKTGKATGEAYIETTPQDIDCAFTLLRDALDGKSDGLSSECANFHKWLKGWADANKKSCFTADDIRKEKRIPPRTLQRYLADLQKCDRINCCGGDRYKGGYRYTLAPAQPDARMPAETNRHIAGVLMRVQKAYNNRHRVVTKKPQIGHPPAARKTAGKRIPKKRWRTGSRGRQGLSTVRHKSSAHKRPPD